jgi:hypothetical protein
MRCGSRRLLCRGRRLFLVVADAFSLSTPQALSREMFFATRLDDAVDMMQPPDMLLQRSRGAVFVLWAD